MNIINEYGSYIIMAVAILASVILFFFNFMSVLNFKWYIDYYKSKDGVCNASDGSKLETENLRYNIYSFLYNKDNEVTFSKLKDDFTTSFYVFISYYTLLIMVFIAASIYYKEYLNVSIYIFLFIIYVTYTTTNAIIVQNFKDIQKHCDDDVYNINIYAKMYKILNAIMIVGNISDVPMEYVHEKLNYQETTFNDILERNISSSENANSSSQVLNIKQKAYDRLDFAKYFTYDKSSPFFVTYFENMYIRLPTSSKTMFDISENILLKDLYMNRNNSANFVTIRKHFKKISDMIGGETRDTYTDIHKKIETDYPIESMDQETEHRNISGFLEAIQGILKRDIRIKQYNLVLFEEVNDLLLAIRMILRNSQYNKVYNLLNEMITDTFEKKQIKISVPDNDYIKYYIDHVDIIINENNYNEEFKDILQMLNHQGDFTYSYIVYLVIILLLISHYLFVHLNSSQHSFILIGTLSVFVTFTYLMSVSTPL